MMKMVVDDNLNSLFSYSYGVGRRTNISEIFAISIHSMNSLLSLSNGIIHDIIQWNYPWNYPMDLSI